MREFLNKKQTEIHESQKLAEYQRKLQNLDKIASTKHHLVSTKTRNGIYGGKIPKNEFEVCDNVLLKSSGIKSLKDKIKEKVSKVKKFPTMEIIPQEDQLKLAQGPFLVSHLHFNG